MTDFRRIILLGLLFLIGVSLWNAWMADHAAKAPAATAQSATATIMPGENTPAPVSGVISVSGDVPAPGDPARYITVQTDVMKAVIDRVGGALVKLELLKYPVAANEPNKPFVLFNQDAATYYVATSGVTGQNLPKADQMVYNTASHQQAYAIKPGEKSLDINLAWRDANGLVVTKTYEFSADDYLIHLRQNIQNQGHTQWQGKFFADLQRAPVSSGGVGPFNFSTYLGAAMSSPEKRYEKISFKNIAENNLDKSVQNGWIAMVQHYFLSAWVPDPTKIYQYYTQTQNINNQTVYTIGLQSADIFLKPGQNKAVDAKLYVGPDIADKLKQIAPGLDLTVDYGVLWFIGVIIFGLMKKIHMLTGNWGWSIVLVTLIIKLLFYKLNSISFRSMAAMRDIQPRLQQMRERCGDDKQKLAQGTMELYRKEKINPLGGCLPLIVQIPVFLALYWVLAGSVELRQAPFILWIHDLSAKDPYYVLPLFMGLTIFIQQWLSPKPPDPMQQKVMMMLPVIFTVLFLSFPSGLVLYWVVNNTLSILQQWYIMKHVVPKAAAKKQKART